MCESCVCVVLLCVVCCCCCVCVVCCVCVFVLRVLCVCMYCVCVCVLCVWCVVCVLSLRTSLLTSLLTSFSRASFWRMAPGPEFGGFLGHGRPRPGPRPAERLRGFIVEVFQATKGPGHPNGSRASFWRLCGPRAAQATQVAPGPYFEGFSAHVRTRPPKWFQSFILESFRGTDSPGHPKGCKASFWRLSGPLTDLLTDLCTY